MIIFGQFLDVFLALLLIVRLVRFGLDGKYRAFLVFVAYDSVQSVVVLVYLAINGTLYLDYRDLWCVMEFISWITTIWMVYALLMSLLKRLPGILRFSIYLLNSVFGFAILLGILTIKPESTAASWAHGADLTANLTGLVAVVGRALSFAELLAITLTLMFILRFPIRVPRNLAVFTAGLSTYLIFQIVVELLRSYVPGLEKSRLLEGAPSYFTAACLVYWLLSLNPAGEQVDATLGRGWQTVPQAHLVRQLEALNAALLRSREQS
jgi:hypothetical protein